MIRFGIVGTGNIAHRFARAISLVKDAKLCAVASRTKENAERFQKEFAIEHCFDSYEAMAKSDVIDVAYIATPHAQHKSCSILMLENGKHVLCEKPMAVNEKEALQMIACAQEHHRFLMEAMWARFTPGTEMLLKLCKEDKILGDIKGLSGDFCYSMGESQQNHHVLKNENGGGSLLDVGIYGLNFANWFLGNPVIVNANASIENGIDTHTTVQMEYKDGTLAQISSAVMLEKPNIGFLYGTKGYAKIERFYAPEEITLVFLDGTNKKIATPYEGNGFEYQIRHVCECIQNEKLESSIISHSHTLNILKQMDSIRKNIHLQYPQDTKSE